MKKTALVSLGVALLAGCATEPVVWQQDNQATVVSTTVVLKSNLWLNKMPTIGEVQENNLHGALYLESDGELPADLDIESITLKQGEETWVLEGDLLELRTHSENQWEVVFVTQLAFDSDLPIDVGLQLHVADRVEWLIERSVKVDSVY